MSLATMPFAVGMNVLVQVVQPLYREMDTTCTLVQVKNRNFFASRSWDKMVVCVAED